jgi:uncharacterized Zn finger protein
MADRYPPGSKPLPVEGGLKARSKRGAIAQTWWSERFIAVLESIVVGGRLERGRAYARRGQVVDLRLDAGAVTATVQGSRAQPYRVRARLAAFGTAEWAEVTRALADDAWYAAKLLAGEMPADIEDVFASVGLSLFPAGAGELSMECTCPDREVPCKHLAAVFYLLAESFDDDPFGILAWRGRDREALLAALSELRTGARMARTADHAGVADLGDAVPLTACLDTYFTSGTAQADPDLSWHVPAGAPSDALLDQVPAVDVTVRGNGLVEVLRPAYVGLGRSSDLDSLGGP